MINGFYLIKNYLTFTKKYDIPILMNERYIMKKTRNISEYYDRLGTICGFIGVLIIGLIGAILTLF